MNIVHLSQTISYVCKFILQGYMRMLCSPQQIICSSLVDCKCTVQITSCLCAAVIAVIVYHLGCYAEYKLGIEDTAKVVPVHAVW